MALDKEPITSPLTVQSLQDLNKSKFEFEADFELQDPAKSQPVTAGIGPSDGTSLTQTFTLSAWHLVTSYPCRVLDKYNDTVLIEVVINKEDREVEEREVSSTYFHGLKTHKGAFLKLQTYKRPNSGMFLFISGEDIVNDDDFPKVDFTELMKDDRLRSM